MIPTKISQTVLNRAALPEETLAVVIALSGSGLGTFVMRGRSSRTFAFQFSKARGAHILRFPASLWEDKRAGIARELFDQNLPVAMIPSVEPWDTSRTLAELALFDRALVPVEDPPAKPQTDLTPNGPGLAVIPGPTAVEIAFTKNVGRDDYFLGTTENPFGPEFPELAAAWTAGQDEAKNETPPEPAFRMDGDDILLGDERVGGLFDPGGHLRMASGKKDLRPAVEAFLAAADPKSPAPVDP